MKQATWTPDAIADLRAEVERCEQQRRTLMRMGDVLVATDYARHVLACLEENQPDTIAPPTALAGLTVRTDTVSVREEAC